MILFGLWLLLISQPAIARAGFLSYHRGTDLQSGRESLQARRNQAPNYGIASLSLALIYVDPRTENISLLGSSLGRRSKYVGYLRGARSWNAVDVLFALVMESDQNA